MKIKICGLFRACDIEYVNGAKPDFIGFVFAKSKRQVPLEHAKFLKSRLDPQITAVGVFMDAELSFVEQVIQEGIIDMVQLHGNETEEYIKKITVPVIKAVRIGDPIPSNADYLLFDSHEAGSGVPFDWSQLPKTEQPFFLAGGITLENLPQAIQLNPFAIDVSSGVETEGLKDKEKIESMVRSVRNV